MDVSSKDQSAQQASQKNSSISIFLFLVGIVAVSVLTVFTTLRHLPSIVLISEIIVLACLIGLLIVSINARRRMAKQLALNERYPYASVEKKEIEAIFDKIAEEEKKRQKLDAFAAGIDLSKMPTVSSAKSTPKNDDDEKEDNKKSSDNVKKTADSPSAAEDEENDMIAVFPDDDEDVDSSADSSKDKKSDKTDEGTDEDTPKKKTKSSSDDDAEKPRKKRPPEANRQRSKSADPRSRQRKQRPYDPYYEDYYYDRPTGGRRRPPQPVYYDEYGNPIRPRVVYDEYGNPIRRRPAGDPYHSGAAPQGKRRRPPEAGAGQKRPAPGQQGAAKPRAGAAAAAAAVGAAGAAAAKKQRTAGHPAPVEMTPIKQHSNYDDEYIPVAIVDEEDYTPAPPSRAPAKSAASKKRPNAQAAKYEPEYDDLDIVVIPDYEEDEYQNDNYNNRAARPASRQTSAAAPQRKGRSQEKYVPSYSEDEVIVTVPDYDDEPEAPVQRHYQQPVEDDYEDEPLVVLPHDEGYEDYMEKKEAEQRRADRKAKGKTALTIRKLRQKKIRRKSRKYKIFHASVHTLTQYLNSFSMRSNH